MSSWILEALRKPVPAVMPGDLVRAWSLLELDKETRNPREVSGVCSRLLAQQPGDDSSALAVFLRAMLIRILVQEGVLDRWRVEGAPARRVFDVAATFPLSRGLEDIDSDAFIKTLESA